MSLRIGILGTRGIPNQYGGFEQLAEYLSLGLVTNGHEVTVYNSHRHKQVGSEWNGVKIVHCFDPEYLVGTAGQFIYDLNCLLDARRRNFDVILMLGYTSSSIWKSFFPPQSQIIFNMDGMEWQRAKYSPTVKKFLRYAEGLAVKYGHHLIADSLKIQSYLNNKYKIDSEYIAYGAKIFTNESEEYLQSFGLKRFEYYLLIARMEPENNLELILDGFTDSRSTKKFVVMGNTNRKFGKYLVNKYKNDSRIIFIGGVFDKVAKHSLTYFCELYFHGHSAGGTNPSLLEAMSSLALIASHDNEFNRAVLQKNAFYFKSALDITKIIESQNRGYQEMSMIQSNFEKIETVYTWDKITDQYEKFIYKCVAHSQKQNYPVIEPNFELFKSSERAISRNNLN